MWWNSSGSGKCLSSDMNEIQSSTSSLAVVLWSRRAGPRWIRSSRDLQSWVCKVEWSLSWDLKEVPLNFISGLYDNWYFKYRRDREVRARMNCHSYLGHIRGKLIWLWKFRDCKQSMNSETLISEVKSINMLFSWISGPRMLPVWTAFQQKGFMQDRLRKDFHSSRYRAAGWVMKSIDWASFTDLYISYEMRSH